VWCTGARFAWKCAGYLDGMTYARARFVSALFAVTAGALMAVGAFTFTPGTERWVGFGVGSSVLAVILLAFTIRRRGMIHRLLDLPLVLICAWSIVCARVIEVTGAGSSDLAIKWWGISCGAAIFGIGIVSLVLHELDLERELRQALDTQWSIRALNARGRAAVDGGTRDPVGNGRYADAVSRSSG
jgi:hypothetical protein